MKKQMRDAWVAELRKGDIKQASHRLGSAETGMCCLGVLAYVCVRDNMVPEGVKIGTYGVGRMFVNNSQGALGGGNNDAPKFGLSRYMADQFITVNDVAGGSFIDIANLIERTVPLNDPDEAS